MKSVLALLQSHRSIRKYTDQPISQDLVEDLVRSGQAAATSSFIQACTLIQVQLGAKRDQLAVLAGNQSFVAEAPVFLVFCADMYRHKLACDTHDAPMNAGFTEQFITATTDVALFAQNVVVAAESVGLGICYIGGLRNHIAQVSELLALPDLVYPVFGLCLGYPAQDPEIKPRLPLNQVLMQEVYEREQDAETMAGYDQQVRAYYASRTGGNKDMTWTEQISGMLQKEARPHMKDFLQKRGFLIK